MSQGGLSFEDKTKIIDLLGRYEDACIQLGEARSPDDKENMGDFDKRIEKAGEVDRIRTQLKEILYSSPKKAGGNIEGKRRIKLR